MLTNVVARLRYWLTARRCVCQGYPHRFAGGTVELGGVLHRTDGPCYLVDAYGQPL
jgi:hypothetical protein